MNLPTQIIKSFKAQLAKASLFRASALTRYLVILPILIFMWSLVFLAAKA